MTSDLSESQDEESVILEPDENTDGEVETVAFPQDGVIGQFDWDDMLVEPPEQREAHSLPRKNLRPYRPKRSQSPRLRSGENTPLLRKATSFSDTVQPHRSPQCALTSLGNAQTSVRRDLDPTVFDQTNYKSIGPVRKPLRRRSSAKVVRQNYGGRSTYGQTVRVFW